jgi:hypothetical protein
MLFHMAAVRPLPPEQRHPSDYRDDAEHAQVAQILSELPSKHPARIAYASGAWEGANTLSLIRLVVSRTDMVDRLIAVYAEHAANAAYRPAPQL